MNISPNLIHQKLHGSNLEVPLRSPSEAEVYGLRVTQLILPRPEHRNPYLSYVNHLYESTRPLVNENRFSSLGIVGSFGLFLLFLSILIKLAGGSVNEKIVWLGLTVYVFFLFGTIGGLGAIFSSVISASIRCWNRMSVFIAFGAITAAFLSLQIFIYRLLPSKNKKFVFIILTVVIVGIGLYDQTTNVSKTHMEKLKQEFKMDRDFINQIESRLPKGSAIYQPFPTCLSLKLPLFINLPLTVWRLAFFIQKNCVGTMLA